MAVTIYVVVGPAAGWADPTAANVKAGQLAGGGAATWAASRSDPGVNGTIEWPTTTTGLTAGTLYRTAYVASDGTTDTAVVVSAEWRTNDVAAFVAAAGASVAAALTGASTATASLTAAAGSSAAQTLTGASTARATITAAAGSSAAQTLTGASTARASITPAAGTSTAATLTGSGSAAGTASIVPASGSSATATLAGAATVRATIVPAAGSSFTATLSPPSAAAASVIAAIAWRPTEPPEDPTQIRWWIKTELEAAANAIARLADGHLDVTHVAPRKPRAGDLRIADGVNWNPGSGAGLYRHDGTTWVHLG